MSNPVDRWWELPAAARAHVLGPLAGLIARGVLIDATEEQREATDDA